MRDESRTGGSPFVRRAVVGAVVVGAAAASGALLGLLWWAIAPRPEGTSLGGGQTFTGTTEDVFAGEGYFVLMTAIAGLITGYVVYMAQFPLARRRMQDLRLTGLIAGVLGSIAAAVLAWQVGVTLDEPLHAAAASAGPGESLTIGLQLDATAFLVAWPFVFVLQYGLLEGISLARRDVPGVPVEESDSTHQDEQRETGPDRETTVGHDTGGPGDTSR